MYDPAESRLPSGGDFDPTAPSPRRLEILATLARLATEDLEFRPMLQRITDALHALVGWEFVALISIDRDQHRFVCEAVTTALETSVFPGYSRPLGSGVVGRVAESGEPLLLDDVSTFPGFVDTLPGARSELCVPIRHRGDVVAVLNVESRRPGAFHGQRSFAEAIAGHIAGAVASAHSLAEARRRADALAVLSEVSRAALGAADLDKVLDRIAWYVQRRFDFFLVAIVVADPQSREWEHRAFATRKALEMKPRDRWPIEDGVVGRALRSGEPQLVLDTAADPDYFPVHDEVVAEFAVPIRAGDRILGVFNIESDRSDGFRRETRELLALLAEQVAGAIRLALLNRNLQETQRSLETANRELERLSLSDPLTGVANRRRFDHALELEWRRLGRVGRPVALLLADVDCFKMYNDSLGHLEGDRCLQRVARLLKSGVRRAGDLVARYGGEEFAILLSDTDAEAAAELAERLRTRLERLAIAHPSSPVAAVLTTSIGVAARKPKRGEAATVLVAAADSALYEAKRLGRNRIVVAGKK